MAVRTALDALTIRPTRFLRSWWPWRSALYLASSALLCAPLLAVGVLLLNTGPAVQVFVVGLLATALTAAASIVIARMERWRLRLVDPAPLGDPHRQVGGTGRRQRLRVRLREQVTWREIGYATFSAAVLCWMDLVVLACMIWFPLTFLVTPLHDHHGHTGATVFTVGVGAALLTAAPYPITAWAGARAAMARAILAPRDTDRLDERVVEVTRSRARLVDAFEVERRRIERDLHDGAQQRLVALNVQLGLAQLDVPPGSEVGEPLRKAQDLAKQALIELRELIRGVHPQVLAERGLAAAVADVAGRSPVPVDVDIRLPGRLPQSIEVTAYFVVVEALANIAKHSVATGAAVTASLDAGRLLLRIQDDGIGGADPTAGTGLVGLADRVAAVDGTVALSSPVGGPTVLQIEFTGVPLHER